MTIRTRFTTQAGARLALALVLAFVGCAHGADSGSSFTPPHPKPADTVAGFLKQHWQRPPRPQGEAPAAFNPLEASLAPAACGTCHPQQYDDWRTALHSKAMSPGLIGQLQNMGPKATDQHESCLECHAPLAEQQQQLVATLGAGSRLVQARADGVSHADGLTCAGCHVRSYRRFGPPRRDGSGPTPGTAIPHSGWQAETAFTDSRFCAACHQFDPDGPSLNGKPLENTFAEWQASRYAREGRQCQSCHMPERRHLWRGIHDAVMVRSGLEISTSKAAVADGRVSWQLAIANRGVGHAFPTYVTPRVVVEIGQQDGQGRILSSTVRRYLIARDVTLDLSSERADTRIFPDEVRRYGYRMRRAPGAKAVRVSIVVEPDAFYANFYRVTLRSQSFHKGREALRQALKRAMASRYELFAQQQRLPN